MAVVRGFSGLNNVVFVALLLCLSGVAFAWVQDPSPLYDGHLVVINTILPEPLKSHATLLLEHTFNARIGNDPDAWAEWLATEH